MGQSIDIILPCRFKPEITQTCIDSVNKYTSLDINWIVIQDGKDDEMFKVLEPLSPKIYNEKPQGWVRAINEGMKWVKSDYVMFLNDDTVATPDWIDKMLKHFENNKNLGVIGPVTNHIEGKQHINYNTDDIFEETKEIVGFCMLFRKEVLDKLYKKDGCYMDERFGFGGQDDADICWRTEQLGYKVGIARDVFIYHYGSKAFRELMTTEESKKYAKSRVKILREKYNLPLDKNMENISTQNIENKFIPNPLSDNQVNKTSQSTSQKPKVLICIPSIRGGLVMPLVHNLIAWKQDSRYDITLYTPMNLFPLDNARNKCVKEFLEMDYDYLWFIDDDVCPPIEALHKLISSGKDIIGGVAFSMRSEDGLDFPYPVTLKYNENKEYELFIPNPTTGIHEIDATGGACIMYKRKVFEHQAMERPYEFKYHRDGTLSLTCDFVVHQKSQAAGFKIYIDFDIMCSHIRDVDIKGINNLMVSER